MKPVREHKCSELLGVLVTLLLIWDVGLVLPSSSRNTLLAMSALTKALLIVIVCSLVSVILKTLLIQDT